MNVKSGSDSQRCKERYIIKHISSGTRELKDLIKEILKRQLNRNESWR